MALQWCDDFTAYGTDATLMLNGLYAQVSANIQADPDPNITGVCLRPTTTGQNLNTKVRKVLTSEQTTVGACLRLWMSQLPYEGGISATFLSFRDSSNNPLWSFRVSTTGQIQVLQNDDGSGVVYVTPGPVLVANAWQHIEVKVVKSTTVGSIEVRVDGVVVLTQTGINTGATAIGQVAQVQDNNNASRGIEWFFKDYVIWDGTGSYNNDFLGSVIVTTIVPDSDNSFNWTPSTGSTGFNLIDEAPPVDGDYIAADDSPPAASVFGMTNLPPDVTSVKGLMTLVRARKTDGGDGNLQVSLVYNAVDDDGADRPMTTGMTYWYDFSEVNPDTTSPWAPAEVDDALIKVNRTL